MKGLHAHMPNFPAKTYFPLQKDKDLDDRRQVLSTFMKDLANRADTRSSKVFRTFLNLDEMIDRSTAF